MISSFLCFLQVVWPLILAVRGHRVATLSDTTTRMTLCKVRVILYHGESYTKGYTGHNYPYDAMQGESYTIHNYPYDAIQGESYTIPW